MVLATGDSDFGPVFRRLRELGKGVVGVGPSSVLSTSVALSCHEFIFTDEGRSGSRRRGAKAMRSDRGFHGGGGVGGGGGRGGWSSMAGTADTPMSMPPQLLSARGGLKIKHQELPVGSGGLRSDSLAGCDPGQRRRTAAPFGRGSATPDSKAKAIADSAMVSALGTTVPQEVEPQSKLQLPSPSQSTPTQPPLSFPPNVGAPPHGSNLNTPETPLLAPGQLLLPEMVTAKTEKEAVRTETSFMLVTNPRTPEPSSHGYSGAAARDSSARVSQPRENGGRARASITGRSAGPGPLSFIRPSEKLYRHLLSLGSTAGHEDGAGSLASDWSDDLSDVTLARGLVSLAEACGGGGSEQARAVAALEGFLSNVVGNGTDIRGGSGAGVLDRGEAVRVARLLQRCGFLSWIAEEQQWLVAVPAGVDVLRRRRDETMVEELLTRCREVGVPFDPALASNLLWSKEAPQAPRKWS